VAALLMIGLLVLVGSAAGAEENGWISGTVRNQTTWQPLAGAQVSVVATDLQTVSDSDGSFLITEVPPGTHTLQISLHGFLTRTTEEINMAPGGVVELELTLQPLVFLSEVVVTPSHFRLMGNQPEQRLFLDRESVDRLPHLADDLYRAISWLPGTSGDDISAKIHIRGGEQNEILVMLDGLEIYEPFHLKDFDSIFSVVDSEAVGGLDMITGGFPAEYGNRMSGVIDISSRTSLGETETTIGASFINAGILSEGSFADNRGQWLASVRRGYLDFILGWVDDDSNFEPVYYDALAKLQYQISERNQLSINMLASRDELEYEEFDGSGVELEEEVVAEDSSSYLWLNLKTSWSKRLFSQTVLSAGRLERQRTGAIYYWSKSAVVDDERSFDFFGLRQDWTLAASDRHFLKWGIDLRRLEGDYDYYSFSIIRDPLATGGGPPLVNENDLELAPDGNHYSLYVADRFQLTKALIAEVGARWDRQTYSDDDQLSPRLNLVYTIGPKSTLRAAWGRYAQAQRIDELQIEDGVYDFYPAQQAEHWLLGLEHHFSHGLTARIEAYHKDLSDIRPRYENMRNQIELFPEIEPDRICIAPARAEATGIEILIQQNPGNGLSWWLSYALASVEDEIDGEMVPRSWDQEHSLSFSFNYAWPSQWNLNLTGTYHSGWPTTEVTAELVQAPWGYWYIQPSYGPRNVERYPSFYRLDARISRQVSFSGSTLIFFFEVLNLLDRENPGRVENYGYQVMEDGSVRVHPDYEYWLPMLPSFGVRWTF
jgi:hypothetical protein